MGTQCRQFGCWCGCDIWLCCTWLLASRWRMVWWTNGLFENGYGMAVDEH